MQRLAGDQMAKRTPPPEPKTTTKVYTDLLRRARQVAVNKDVDLFDYIDSILRPAVDTDYRKMIEREAKDLDED